MTRFSTAFASTQPIQRLLRGAVCLGVFLAAACNSPEEVQKLPLVLITPSTLTLRVGETRQLSGQPVDGDGKNLSLGTISWTSDKVAVARVSDTGLVTAVSVGTAVVTAQAAGVSGGLLVTVTP